MPSKSIFGSSLVNRSSLKAHHSVLFTLDEKILPVLTFLMTAFHWLKEFERYSNWSYVTRNVHDVFKSTTVELILIADTISVFVKRLVFLLR